MMLMWDRPILMVCFCHFFVSSCFQLMSIQVIHHHLEQHHLHPSTTLTISKWNTTPVVVSPPKCTTSKTMEVVPVPHQQFQKQILCPGSCFTLVSTLRLQNSLMTLDSLMNNWTGSFTSFITAGLSSLPSRIAKM